MSSEREKRKSREWYNTHPEQALATRRNYYASGKAGKNRKRWYLRQKLEVLTHYGMGKCACVKCGFGDLRALSIDHVDGGGTRHRLTIGKSSATIYIYLKRKGYPKGYQTLCMNCQFIKRHENKEHYNGWEII